ncbi:MAG: fibrobacter succinogenes major paralogous domain-containing protein [Bacteroidales bacterium]|jgi:uncharacterized protein (TIGR02145 family)
MKLYYCILLSVVITNGLSAQGITKYGESTNSSTNFVNQNGKTGSSSMLNKNGKILSSSGTVTDCDGNVYTPVTIGTQVWLSENLKTTHYTTGCTAIPYASGSTWTSESTGAYTYYATYDTTVFGLLYNWYAVTNTDSLCPSGWHVPDSTEWGTLISYLGGYSSAGGALKQSGTTYWAAPNTGATNSSGFTALPGGYYNGSPSDITNDGNYWTSTASGSNAYYMYLYYGAAYVQKNTSAKTLGYSVRCIKN